MSSSQRPMIAPGVHDNDQCRRTHTRGEHGVPSLILSQPVFHSLSDNYRFMNPTTHHPIRLDKSQLNHAKALFLESPASHSAYEKPLIEAPLSSRRSRLFEMPFTSRPALLPPLGFALGLLAGCSHMHASRFLYPYVPIYPEEIVVVHWDSDIGAAGNVVLALWVETVSTGEMKLVDFSDYVSSVHVHTSRT